MLVYVSHCYGGNPENIERAKRITHDLQVENPTHCFIPAAIAFEHLYNGDFSQDDIFDIEADLLMNCDQMLIVSDISPIMRRQIDYCQMVGMEVVDLAEKYRSI